MMNKTLTFPLKLNQLTSIDIHVSTQKGSSTLKVDRRVIGQLKSLGTLDETITRIADHFGVEYRGGQLFIKVPENQLKMGKDKILQTIVILATKKWV